MRKNQSIDLGSIQVHKKVVAEIIDAAISEMGGVSIIQNNLSQKIFKVLGKKNYPGIILKVQEDGQVCVEVKVFIQYGLNIPDIARQIQDVIKAALDQTVDVDIKNINVNIQGIERGQK